MLGSYIDISIHYGLLFQFKAVTQNTEISSLPLTTNRIGKKDSFTIKNGIRKQLVNIFTQSILIGI